MCLLFGSGTEIWATFTPDDAISGMADASRCQRRQFSIELRQCLHKNTKKQEIQHSEIQKIHNKEKKYRIKKKNTKKKTYS